MSSTGIPSTFSPLLIALATVLYGVIHSLLAATQIKARIYARFGDTARRWYRLIYNAFATLSFIPVLLLVAFLPDTKIYTIPSPYRWVTLAVQGVAALLVVIGVWQTDAWTFLGLRQISTPTNEDTESRLVISGLYRWVRHPLYSAGLVFLWLTPLMSLNTLAFNLSLTIYIIIGALHEESRLLKEFGEAYQTYRECVPMLIPWRKPCQARTLETKSQSHITQQ